MATHRISILGPMTVPDADGDVFFQPYSVVDSGAAIDPLVLMFNNSGNKDGVRGVFEVPQNYVGTANLVIKWTANATSGTCIFDWSVLPRAITEDMGAAAARTTETATDTKTGTAFLLEVVTMTLTDADYAAGDVVTFEFFRDSPTDSMAAAAAVFSVHFEYNDA